MDPISLKFKNVRLEGLFRQDIINQSRTLFLWVHILCIGITVVFAIYLYSQQIFDKGTLCVLITLYLSINFWIGRYKFPNTTPYLLSLLSILSCFQQFYTQWDASSQDIFFIASMAMIVHFTLLVGFDFIQNAVTIAVVIITKTTISILVQPTILAFIFPFFGLILGYSVYQFQRVQRRLFLQSQQELDNEFYLDQGFDDMILRCRIDKQTNNIVYKKSNQSFQNNFGLKVTKQLATFLKRFQFLSSSQSLDQFIWKTFLKIEPLQSENLQTKLEQIICRDKSCKSSSTYSFRILFSFLQGAELIVIFRNETFHQQFLMQKEQITFLNQKLMRQINKNQKIIYKIVKSGFESKPNKQNLQKYLLVRLMMATQNIRLSFNKCLMIQKISLKYLQENLNRLTTIYCAVKQFNCEINCQHKDNIVNTCLSLVFQLHLLIIQYVSLIIREHPQKIRIMIESNKQDLKNYRSSIRLVYLYIQPQTQIPFLTQQRLKTKQAYVEKILKQIGAQKEIKFTKNQFLESIQVELSDLEAMIDF